jgi:hypothetical protein
MTVGAIRTVVVGGEAKRVPRADHATETVSVAVEVEAEVVAAVVVAMKDDLRRASLAVIEAAAAVSHADINAMIVKVRAAEMDRLAGLDREAPVVTVTIQRIPLDLRPEAVIPHPMISRLVARMRVARSRSRRSSRRRRTSRLKRLLPPPSIWIFSRTTPTWPATTTRKTRTIPTNTTREMRDERLVAEMAAMPRRRCLRGSMKLRARPRRVTRHHHLLVDAASSEELRASDTAAVVGAAVAVAVRVGPALTRGAVDRVTRPSGVVSLLLLLPATRTAIVERVIRIRTAEETVIVAVTAIAIVSVVTKTAMIEVTVIVGETARKRTPSGAAMKEVTAAGIVTARSVAVRKRKTMRTRLLRKVAALSQRRLARASTLAVGAAAAVAATSARSSLTTTATGSEVEVVTRSRAAAASRPQPRPLGTITSTRNARCLIVSAPLCRGTTVVTTTVSHSRVSRCMHL